jgi:NifU-like protein involved in Fe-S cluster formation
MRERTSTMWDYTDKVKDHFINPRNVGEMENPTCSAEVGSLACGDALRLMLKLDENERILDAKFSPSAVPAPSPLPRRSPRSSKA